MRKRYRLYDGNNSSNSLAYQLLKNRNIEDTEDFLNPSYEKGFHDPFLLADMQRAVQRILSAIDNGEKILIYSDYDADGIPAGVMMKDFFNLIGYANAENYIPHRHDEGFGLNHDAIDSFVEKGVNLLITLDCGIADHSEIAYAMNCGIDVIVTDHHEQNGELPKAFAVIDPKRKDDSYPFKGLCGSGVGWKLIQALLISRDFGIKEGSEKWLLDMVGIATLSDMVPLIDENRILGKYGLMVLRKSRRPGIRKLLSLLKIDQRHITEDDIGFMIAPRINAASRMGDPGDAFALLSANDEVEAEVLAKRLEEINNERKGVVASIVKDIKKKLKGRQEIPSVIVMGNPDWRPSLLGLVAGSLSEEYERPVFLWGREGKNLIKGSCRSEGVTDLISLMLDAGEVFAQFGGHKMAGGFEVTEDGVHTLEKVLCEKFSMLSNEKTGDDVLIDRSLMLNDVSFDTYRHIENVSPYGVGHSKPLFLFENVLVKGLKLFGKQKNHLSITVSDNSNRIMDAIAFFSEPDSFGKPLKVGNVINVVGNIEKSVFRGRPELRIRLVDVIDRGELE